MTYSLWSDFPEKRGAYALLRYAAEARLGAPCPDVEKDAHGKPYFPARPELHFSLSHTRGAVMVCLGDAPCGCDIELVRPVRKSVARRVCTPRELAELDFFELWTLKESFFKLRGRSDAPFWEARFSRSADGLLAPDPTVQCALFRLGPYMSAVCSRSPAAAPEFVPADILTNLLQSEKK